MAYYKSGGLWLPHQTSSPTVLSNEAAIYARDDLGVYVANGVHPERLINNNGVGRPSGNGQYSWTCDPGVAINATTTPSSSRIYCFSMDWFSTRTIGTLYYYVHTAGATLTTARNWVALYDGLSGARLWVSPDQTTNFGSSGLKTLTGVATQVVSNSSGRVIAAFMSTGTTPAIMRGNNPGPGLANLGMTDVTGYNAWTDPLTGQTAMPASITPFPTAPATVNNVFFSVGP